MSSLKGDHALPDGARVEEVLSNHRAGALLLPLGASKRRIDWRYAGAVGGCHLLACLAFSPWFFSWTGLALAWCGIFIFGGLGINLCYHRLLCHRSFQCPLWLEHTLACIAVCCFEDSPARWVATHRLHHHHSDERPDPHSPLVNLFWSYMGWLFIENTDLNRVAAYDRYARDIIRDRFYAGLERTYPLVVVASWLGYFTVGFFVGLALTGTVRDAVQYGASIWLWGAVVRTVLVWHITWCGNSFPHLFGYRNYETRDNSRNNIIVAVITSGEGWHNNHHAEPGSASNSHRWWELDMTYLALKLFVLLGLAWNVQLPTRLADVTVPPL
ncbi:acyl-CoA desaturase [Bradyrhizobium sp.]|uniref:acyl-CoA desaturase n=1 Tax=Bradyrhizobium sp. TaxID=376 RepID=UPI003C4122DA